jgi:bacteriocin-like protein
MKILDKNEMKNIKGGNQGSCCWHNEGWGANECGISRSEAMLIARDRAMDGERTFWCCSSCSFE